MSESISIEKVQDEGKRKCPKCRVHGEASYWKGHKRKCPYKKCPCIQCQLVDRRRGITKLQVRLYREQKEAIPSSPGSPKDSAEGGEAIEDAITSLMMSYPVTSRVLYLAILKACFFDVNVAQARIDQGIQRTFPGGGQWGTQYIPPPPLDTVHPPFYML